MLVLCMGTPGCVGNSVGLEGGGDDGEDAGPQTTGSNPGTTSSGGDDADDWGATYGSASISDGAWDDDGPGPVSATTAWDTGWGTDDWGDTGWNDTGWATGWGTDDWGTDDWGTGEPCLVIDLGSAMGSEVYAGVLEGGTDLYTLACAGQLSDDVTLTWTPPDIGDYTIRLESAAFDPVLGLSAELCGGPSFGCSDDCVGTGAGMVLSGWQGSVAIVVEAGDGGGGAFSLSIEPGASLQCD